MRHHSVARAVCRAWAGCRCRRRGARQVRHGATIPIPAPASTSSPPTRPTRLFLGQRFVGLLPPVRFFLFFVATLSRRYGWIKATRVRARPDPLRRECLFSRPIFVFWAVYRGVAPIPLVPLRFVYQAHALFFLPFCSFNCLLSSCFINVSIIRLYHMLFTTRICGIVICKSVYVGASLMP